MFLKEGEVSKGFKGKKLTPKMISFIDEYFGDAAFNATEAYRRSLYKSVNNPTIIAMMLLKHPLVKEEIDRRMALRAEKAEVKAEFLIMKLMDIISATEKSNPQAALRAIELAGKSIALWKDRQEISGPDGEAIKHEQHVKESVNDFTSRIAGLAQRAGTSNVIEFPATGSDSGT